jgi:ubiquinone/menaquinone biosynthesis C-methylase UbiE
MSDPYGRSSRFYNPIVEPWLRSMKEQIVQECARLNLSRVLDVGCGTGTLAGMLRKEEIQSVGLDPSPGMIRVSHGISRGSFALVRGRGEALPFSSGVFQGVIFSMVFHENHPSRRREMLEEALRVLDPRGTLFILDYCKPSTASGQAAGIIEYLVEWVVGGEHFHNYRQFMAEGALPGFLTHIPKEKIHWQSGFHGSMSIARYHPGGFSLGGKDCVTTSLRERGRTEAIS